MKSGSRQNLHFSSGIHRGGDSGGGCVRGRRGRGRVAGGRDDSGGDLAHGGVGVASKKSGLHVRGHRQVGGQEGLPLPPLVRRPRQNVLRCKLMLRIHPHLIHMGKKS